MNIPKLLYSSILTLGLRNQDKNPGLHPGTKALGAQKRPDKPIQGCKGSELYQVKVTIFIEHKRMVNVLKRVYNQGYAFNVRRVICYIAEIYINIKIQAETK